MVNILLWLTFLSLLTIAIFIFKALSSLFYQRESFMEDATELIMHCTLFLGVNGNGTENVAQ
jgi:hypothetical protein